MTASAPSRVCTLPKLPRPYRVSTVEIAPEDSVVGWDKVPPHATTPFMVGLRPTLQSSLTRPDHTITARIAPENTVKLEKVYRLCRKRRRGVAAVEFALVAPLFFLLVFGMIEFGRGVMVQQVITNASREGARLAVLDETDITVESVKTRVKNLHLVGIKDADVNADVELKTAAPPYNEDTEWITITNLTSIGYDEPVMVVVTIPFNKVSWLPLPMFIGGRQLTASTVMRKEGIK